MHKQSEKNLARDAAIRRIKAMTQAERIAESRSVCKHILHHFPAPKGVCAYYPLNTEVNILPVLQTYLANGISVYMPSFSGKDFTFKKVTSLEEMRVHKISIPEPLQNAKEVDFSEVEVLFIPGRAFTTKEKLRLGRGNGGYDRLIANFQSHRPKLVGVCFECQLFPTLPTEPHDQPLDEIMTARKLYWNSAEGRV